MRTRPLHKGTIVGLRPNKKTGIAVLEINDDRRGKVLVPCYGKPTVDAFAEAFPGTVVGRHFNNDAIAGEEIFYRVNELGLLCEFCPVDEKAPPELVAEYEAQSAPPKKARFINEGLCKPDDPIYSTGPIVNGREILKKKPPERGIGKVTVGGFLPPGDPMYSRGLMVFGRPDPPKKKPPENN